jgi:hypothetical protein
MLRSSFKSAHETMGMRQITAFRAKQRTGLQNNFADSRSDLTKL